VIAVSGERHTLGVLVENRPGVLTRVAGLFTRRGFNIESLAVGPTDDATVSRMTIVVEGDGATVEQIRKQLMKLVDVIEVVELEPSETVTRELVLVKVEASPSARPGIIQIADVFRAKVVDVAKDTLILEITGDEGKVRALLEIVKDYGVVEMVRTGTVALGRGTGNIMSANQGDDDAWQRYSTTKMPI